MKKTLLALTLLGSHGQDVYNKFLDALSRSNFQSVVQELRRTEKNIKFGNKHRSIKKTVLVRLFSLSHWLICRLFVVFI